MRDGETTNRGETSPPPAGDWYRRGGKRVLDVVLAAAGLTALSPLLALLAGLIKWSSPGPVFFRQERVGRDGRAFRLLKFRTMVVGADRDPRWLTGADDDRLTRLGRFLRQGKLDELPQLWNVLCGEMSLVGPRPELPVYVAHYSPDERRVLTVRPGVTGPASLAYRRQEELLAGRADWHEYYLRELMPKKLALNLDYLGSISLARDLVLLGHTAAALAADALRLLGRRLGRHYDPTSRANQRLIDAAIAGGSLFLAYQLRFEGEVDPAHWVQFWLWLPLLVLGRLLANQLFGVYRLIWRYVSVREAVHIALVYAGFSGALFVLRVGLPEEWFLGRLPLSVIALEFLLSLVAALGARLLRRILYEASKRWAAPNGRRRKVVLVGAGQVGAQVAKELRARAELHLVAFLDDDPKKWGTQVAGVRVVGPLEKLPDLVRQEQIDDAVLCVARTRDGISRRFLRLAAALPVRPRMVPSVEDVLEGKVALTAFRNVTPEELLGREPRQTPEVISAVAESYRGRRLLVTGAGGSIGGELSRQLAQAGPACLLLLDKDENGLFELLGQLSLAAPAVRAVPLVRDIRQPLSLRRVFAEHRPEIIFHAAAHKHVPLMEANPAEAVLNNVFGTLNLVELAEAFGAERFLLISTDKAVNPTSVMGASKRLAELVVEERARRGRLRLGCVRFGNVLESRGSVIPLFKRQIAAGGPVTITHPDVVRYFMTIPEAVQLVLQAGTLAARGEIFVLDMGDPHRVVELARDLIELSGLCPDKDIRLVTTGLRPGEKMWEELAGPDEVLEETGLARLKVIHRRVAPPPPLEKSLARLRQSCRRGDADAVRRALVQLGLRAHAEPKAASLA